MTRSLPRAIPLLALALALTDCRDRTQPSPPDDGPGSLTPCPRGPPVDTCGAIATDLESDAANCGTCGNVCPQGGACGVGLCWAPGDPAQCSDGAPARRGSWRELGPPFTGRISAIAPGADLQTAMVATPGGGLWTTGDGGVTWSHSASDGLADANVLRLARDGSDASRLYALTTSDLYASTDGGQTWWSATRTGGHPRIPVLTLGAADPMPFAQLLPAGGGSVLLWGHPGGGLSWSSDGGETAHQVFPFAGGAANRDNTLLSIAADDATGRVYFTTAGDHPTAPHLFRSTSAWTAGAPAAAGWEPAVTGIVDSRTALVAWAGVPGRLVVVRSDNEQGAYTAIDGGDHWIATATSPGYAPPRPVLVPEPDRIIVGGVLGRESLDFGATWSTFQRSITPYSYPDVRSLALQPTTGTVWAGSDNSANDSYVALVRYTYAPGSPLSNPVPITTAGALGVRTWQLYYAIPVGSAPTLLVGSQDGWASCSDDDGATWDYPGSLTLPPGNFLCGDAFALAVAPSQPSRAYALTCAADYILRTDAADAACGSVNFTGVGTAGRVFYSGLPWSAHLIDVDPANPDHFAFARLNDVGVSTDAGASVTVRPIAGPTAVHYDAAGTLYVGTRSSGVFRSSDDGATFESLGLAGTEVRALAWSPAGGGEGTLFAGTTDGLYRRAPGGTFQRVLGGGGYLASEVTVDPSCATRVYAGFGFDWSAPHRGGVALSTDGGLTWTSLSVGSEVHKSPVSSIRVHPGSSSRVYVGTYGRGAWSFEYVGAAPACE